MALGRRIARELQAGDIVSLEGGLGAGKTTIAKGIIAGLGITETVTSPTYTIISEYAGRLPVYHMDLYRIDDPEELTQIGLEEYLYGRGISLIEWIDRMRELPEGLIRVSLEVSNSDNLRTVRYAIPVRERVR